MAIKMYSKNEEIIDSEIDDEIVMMDVENGAYYGMDNIGSFVWKMLETPKSITEIVDGLTNEFDVSKQQCKSDITPFIDRLVKANIVIEINNKIN